jgi:hypothetical protein
VFRCIACAFAPGIDLRGSSVRFSHPMWRKCDHQPTAFGGAVMNHGANLNPAVSAAPLAKVLLFGPIGLYRVTLFLNVVPKATTLLTGPQAATESLLSHHVPTLVVSAGIPVFPNGVANPIVTNRLDNHSSEHNCLRGRHR